MSPSIAVPDSRPGLPQTVGYYALAFFIFSLFSGAVDFATRFAPVVLAVRPSLIAAFLGLSIIGLSGRVGILIRHKVATIFLALTLWFILCVPFSVWPGGAAATITNNWMITVLSLFMAGGLIWDYNQCRKIVHLIAYSAIILSVLTLVYGDLNIEGRITLPGTRFANPNDLAVDLLTALPFLAFTALRKGNGIRRFLAMAGFIPAVWVIALTGSRAAEVAAVVALLTAFLGVGLAQKIRLLAAGAVIFVLLFFALPSNVTSRLLTVFGSADDITQMDDLTLSSIESTQARRILLMDSIAITFQHPLFGVGPGNFPVAQDTLARARGEVKGSWHVTHNTYTQVSSESGLPGLALFLLAIFYCLRSVLRILRRPVPAGSTAWQDMNTMAFAMAISLVAFLTSAIFASEAYLPTIALLFGIAISMDYCVATLPAAVSQPVSPIHRAQTVRFSPRRPLTAPPGRHLPEQRVS